MLARARVAALPFVRPTGTVDASRTHTV